ncbi:MAG: nucleotide exchange factor GrpE [Alphaproteobacteria bacterium]|nr:nucleotide exchange factor GrpE [Alphaproteobacteria bacterium]
MAAEDAPAEEDDLHAGYDAAVEDEGGEPDFRAVIDALRAELEQNKEQMMRALAEAENTRKRAQKDREDASKFAVSGFAKDLLDVADNLRRALAAVPEDLLEADVRVKNLLDGIEGTERQLLRSFEKNGIQKLDPLGEPFDPNFHEVMFESPAPDKPAGTIVQVLEVGYVLNGRILRPARVGIAKDEGQGGPQSPPTEPGGTIDTEI